MGDWSYLLGCRSKNDAERRALSGDEDREELGPTLAAKYQIPFFWLAAFGVDSAFTVRRAPGPEDEFDPGFEDFIVLWSPAQLAAERLRRRRDAILEQFQPTDAEFVDDWIHFVERSYPYGLLLQAEEVMGITGFDEAGELLVAALRGLGELDAGRPLGELQTFASLGAAEPDPGLYEPGPAESFAAQRRAFLGGLEMRDGGWPGEPTAAEIAAAATMFRPEITTFEQEQAKEAAAARPKPWWAFWPWKADRF